MGSGGWSLELSVGVDCSPADGGGFDDQVLGDQPHIVDIKRAARIPTMRSDSMLSPTGSLSSDS